MQTTVHAASVFCKGYFQHDAAPRRKAKVVSDWFREHDSEFSVQWPSRSQDLNPHLGCGRTKGSQHGSAADKSAETPESDHVSLEQNLQGMFPTSCAIYAKQNSGCFQSKGSPFSVSVIVLVTTCSASGLCVTFVIQIP